MVLKIIVAVQFPDKPNNAFVMNFKCFPNEADSPLFTTKAEITINGKSEGTSTCPQKVRPFNAPVVASLLYNSSNSDTIMKNKPLDTMDFLLKILYIILLHH